MPEVLPCNARCSVFAFLPPALMKETKGGEGATAELEFKANGDVTGEAAYRQVFSLTDADVFHGTPHTHTHHRTRTRTRTRTRIDVSLTVGGGGTGDVIHLLAASGLLRSLEAQGVAQHRQAMVGLSKEFGVLCSQTAYTVVEVGRHPFSFSFLINY